MLVAFAVGACSGFGASPTPPSKPPMVAVYELEHEVAFFPGEARDDLPGAVVRPEGTYVRSVDRFVWEYAGPAEWTWRRICCPDPIDGSDPRDEYQVRPDGTRWYREGPSRPWEFVGTFDPDEGWSPLPDLAPRPGAAVEVPADHRAALAASGVEAARLRAVRIDEGSVRTELADLGIPVAYTERAPDGYLVRRLLLESLTRP